MNNDLDRAHDALHFLDPSCDRETWRKAGMGLHAAGGDFDTFDKWSRPGDKYNFSQCRSAWQSFSQGKGIGVGTLFRLAKAEGWQDTGKPPAPCPRQAAKKPVEPPRKVAPGMGATEIFSRCEAATNSHPYLVQKGAVGVPLENLRVVPKNDPLVVQGERMAGALVVPVVRPDGTLASLQFITPPDVGARLKKQGKTDKPNLRDHSLEGGWFTVGELTPGGVVYICEGVGAAWSCWQASANTPGAAAVGCFGSGNMRKVAAGLRLRDPAAKLVLVADVGKEKQAEAIAKEVNGATVFMPDGWPDNSDVNDLHQAEDDALEMLLLDAVEPPKPAARYKLMSSADLHALPPLAWRVRGVLPAVGLAGLYGPSASGKSFLALDMGAAIAEGSRWFNHRVEAAPVVYCALEGEAGFKLRAQAWEAHYGRTLPDDLHMVLQPFQLTDPRDVLDLAGVVPKGAVLFIDTLNRAAPTADENSSKDMGEILTAAKRLQTLIDGLVVLVHHTGKDATKGLRGHSSLFAAMDAAVEVSRDGDARTWKVAKAKDGEDGNAHPFRLKVETLGCDNYGDPMTSCVVVTDTNAADIQRVKVPQGDNQRLVYEGIRGLFKDGATGKTGAPPLRPCIELEAAVAAGASRLTCTTDKRTSRARLAITGLVARGVLGLNEGWLWTA